MPRPKPRPKHCAWCGRVVEPGPTNRPRKFCNQSCRQRAYEQRAQLAGTSIPADSVILSASAAQKFHDDLFELRCAAEDLCTAAREGESAEVVEELASELEGLATRVEQLRGRR